MGFRRSASARFSVVRNLFRFLASYKSWWMIPMIVMLLVFFVVIIIGQSTPLGPFIYAIF